MGKYVPPWLDALVRARVNAIARRGVQWCVWKALFPAAVIMLIWPIFFSKGLDHPFHRAFANGELIFLGAMILLEVGAELEGDGAAPMWLTVTLTLIKALGVLLVFIFAAVKIDATAQEIELGCLKPGDAKYQPILTRLLGYSYFSWSVVIVCVATAFVVLVKIVEYQTEEERRAFGA